MTTGDVHAVDERYCRKCYYNLRGLPEQHRCPECGTDFDISDPATFRGCLPSSRWRWVRRGVLAVVALALVIGGAWGWMYWGWKQEQNALAKLPVFPAIKTAPVGPKWLYPLMGKAGFVLERVREVDGWRSPATYLSPVAKLTRLERLDLPFTQVSDLSPLSRLTSLQRLDLTETYVKDLSPLARLTSMQRLHLTGTPVSDLSPLAGLTALQLLDLGGTQVTDLSPLTRLTALQSLDLTATPVKDLSPLAQLTAMQDLYLCGTPVKDLSPLSGLTNLRTLYVPTRTISQDQGDQLQRALPSCFINRL